MEEWELYGGQTDFCYAVLPDGLKHAGTEVTFQPRHLIVTRREFPQYICFIISGRALGTRYFADGNEFSYFEQDERNGSIGLLEILARRDEYVATIMVITEVKVVRMEAAPHDKRMSKQIVNKLHQDCENVYFCGINGSVKSQDNRKNYPQYGKFLSEFGFVIVNDINNWTYN